MVPRTIRQQLSRLRWRERGLQLAWGVSRSLAFVIALLALACLTDWLVDRRQDTPWALRVGMLAGQIALWALAGWFFLLRPLWHRLTDSKLALWVEERVASLGHRLISAVQLNQPAAQIQGMSPELIAAVTREAETQTAGMNFAKLADHRRLKWSALASVPALCFVLLCLALFPATAIALLARQFLADREIPRSVRLESVDNEIIAPAGEEVVLRFHVNGEGLKEDLQGEVVIVPQGQSAEHYPLIAESLWSPQEGIFTAHIPSAAVDFTYRAWLKDGRTRHPASVHFEPEPAIVEHRAWVILPSYYGLRPDGTPFEQAQPRGDIIAPPNAKARVAIKTQKQIAIATLELLGVMEPPAGVRSAVPEVLRRIDMPLGDESETAQGSFDLRPEESQYRVVVKDRYGFTNAEPAKRSIRIIPEEAPRVTLLPEQFPALDDQGPAEESEVDGVPVPLGGGIRIAYNAAAGFGLGRAQLRYRINEGSWTPLPLSEVAAKERWGLFDPRRGAFEKSGAMDQVEFHAIPSPDPEQGLGRLEGGGRFDFQTRRIPNLKIGDKLEFYVEVFDHNPDPERLPGRSESRVKSIVTGPEFVAWVRQTLQEENRIRQLENKQGGVFPGVTSNTGDDVVTGGTTTPLDGPKELEPTSSFLRDWQLLGPFAAKGNSGFDVLYPPETDKFDQAKEYDGLRGKIQWKAHSSPEDHIILDKFFSHEANGVAYGICWVHSDRKKPVLLSIGSDDGCKIWINRKSVFGINVNRPASPGQDHMASTLGAGWNEVMIKVDNSGGNLWGFYLELQDPQTHDRLKGLRVRAKPPPGGPKPAPPVTEPNPKRFLRAWQLIGPFPNPDSKGHGTAYRPETEKIDLDQTFDGLGGKVKWKAFRSPQDRIDLAKFFARPFEESNVCYAACWVRSDKARPALLATGSDDGIKVWINRKLVLDKAVYREAVPGDDTEKIDLAAGWNEVLVKIDNRSGAWAFYFELRDRDKGRPLDKIDVRITPPEKKK